MKSLDKRLKVLKNRIDEGKVTIMIMGLGSVGLYLLDYIVSMNDPAIRIIVTGRNAEKLESDVNIVRVAALIRQQNKSEVVIDGNCELSDVASIADCIKRHEPDFIVNSSRVYAGLKYGSISWHNLRAYGIWTPLAIHFIKNIMQAWERADSNAIVINTSYSDAVIPWLKSANQPYPDFGSGNLNHLIPRIRFAAAKMLGISDYWNIDVTIATAHFHDVVISKEGQTEGQDPLLEIKYKGNKTDIDTKRLYQGCKITMPVDAKRNMMNASSNFDIIQSVIQAIREKKVVKFHSPGALGNVGGYPVLIDGSTENPQVSIDCSAFLQEEMEGVNRASIALDGIESVENGVLSYTDTLINKTKEAFGVDLPKRVPFESADETADFIIKNIIERRTVD